VYVDCLTVRCFSFHLDDGPVSAGRSLLIDIKPLHCIPDGGISIRLILLRHPESESSIYTAKALYVDLSDAHSLEENGLLDKTWSSYQSTF